MVRETVASVVRASTACDAVPKGAIPFYAFALVVSLDLGWQC